MSGDDLIVFLFFLGFAVTFGLESAKAETVIRKASFGVAALVGLLTSIFWLQLKALWPSLSEKIAAVATNPVSWFVVFMFMLGIFAFHRPNNKSRPSSVGAKADQSSQSEATPHQIEAHHPIQKDRSRPKEFLQVTPEYLLSIREDRKYTSVQIDRMLEPYIGKWMKIDGSIRDISSSCLMVRIPRPSEKYEDYYFDIALYFEAEWAGRFHALGAGHRVLAIGKLRRIYAGAVELELAGC